MAVIRHDASWNFVSISLLLLPIAPKIVSSLKHLCHQVLTESFEFHQITIVPNAVIIFLSKMTSIVRIIK